MRFSYRASSPLEVWRTAWRLRARSAASMRSSKARDWRESAPRTGPRSFAGGESFPTAAEPVAESPTRDTAPTPSCPRNHLRSSCEERFSVGGTSSSRLADLGAAVRTGDSLFMDVLRVAGIFAQDVALRKRSDGCRDLWGARSRRRNRTSLLVLVVGARLPGNGARRGERRSRHAGRPRGRDRRDRGRGRNELLVENSR